MQTLAGRTCIFSGATGGDGVETVKQLCAGGMNVVMMTHNEARAIELSSEINAMGLPGICTYYVGGNGKEPAEFSGQVYEEIVEKFGSVDVVISNTGSNGKVDDFETVPYEEFQKNVDHLVVGAFRTMQAALPYLKKSKAPRLIFMTSTEGVRGGTYESFSNAVAKGAVESLTLNAAARLARLGITVNCIAKGAITRLGGPVPGEPDPVAQLDAVPVGRIGTPSDLAGAICFLASEESAYITGQILELSGGLNLGR